MNDDVEIVVGSREQLFHLLAEASEIEHTLMCSYLYAAFSLKRAGERGLSAEEGEAVERWRKSILAVATEEMLHLLLVANICVGIGGRPHFGRPNFPVEPGYFPSGVVVKLTPFNAETLDHFIFLERPRGIHEEDGDGFEHEREYRREEAYQGLMPSVQDYATVGHLYEAVRLNMTSLARRLGEGALFVGPTSGQIDRDVMDFEGLTVVADLASALRAIDTIIEQGEGSAKSAEHSHYERFLSIKAEFERLRELNPKFQPAWPAAESPVMRRPPQPEGKIFIDEPSAARLLDLANAVYGTLLRCLVQAFGATGAVAKAKAGKFLSAAIELMHVLADLSSLLARTSGSLSHPEINAGMTFTMLRSVEPFYVGDAEQRLPVERLTELMGGARDLAGLFPQLHPLPARLQRVIGALQSSSTVG
jgi:hypothetical protein